VLKVDLHNHTADDPYDRIPHTTATFIERAAQLGYDAVAITLHDTQYDPAPLAEVARHLGVTLIPGIERTIHGRHVLLLNYPADAVRAVTEYAHIPLLKARHPNGLVIVPHPFFPLGNCMRGWTDRYSDLFDAVEYNGCYATAVNFNRRVTAWARAHGKPLVGGSDTHRLMAFGSTYTLVDADGSTPDAICAAVKAGRVALRTSPMPLLRLAEYLGRMVLGGHHPRRGASAGSWLAGESG
jgi:predicted metal-dependent phosphoesterase TrpH